MDFPYQKKKNCRSLALLLQKYSFYLNIMAAMGLKCYLNATSSIKKKRLKRRDGGRNIKRKD